MDITSILTLAACGISLVAAAVASWYARVAASSKVRNDVDALLETVDRFTRNARREQMRRVRSSTPAVEGDVASDAPVGLVAVPSKPLSAAERKHELRRKILGRVA